MQYLRKLNIFQVYRRLPYIVYKHTYLIPQQPFPALHAESAKELILDPSKVSIAKAQKGVKEDKVYQQQMLEYKNKYILPVDDVKKKTSIAIKLFLEEHGEQPSSLYDNKPIKSLVVGQITKVYKSLPQQVRDSYDKKAETIYTQLKKSKDDYDAKHKIPTITKMTTVQYYKSQMKLLIDAKSIPKFSSLSEKEQKKFSKECKLVNKQANQQLQKFLAKHSLSQNEFAAITEICLAAERCAVLLKRFKETQKKKIEYFSKIKEKNEDIPDFDGSKSVQEQLKNKLKLLEGLPKQKLNVIAKIIGFQVGNQQNENNNISEKVKVQDNTNPSVKAKDKKKAKQKPIKKEKIKKETAHSQPESKAAPAQQKVIEKKPEPQSPIPQEKKEQNSEQPSKAEKNSQAKLQFSNQPNIPKEYSDVLLDLQDENLNDLNILDQDYEVMKFNGMLEKARQLNLSKHNLKC